MSNRRGRCFRSPKRTARRKARQGKALAFALRVAAKRRDHDAPSPGKVPPFEALAEGSKHAIVRAYEASRRTHLVRRAAPRGG